MSQSNFILESGQSPSQQVASKSSQAANAPNAKHEVKLPGFGLPLFASRTENGFRHALFTGYEFPRVAREYTMQNLMNKITDKPEWQLKVWNDTIVEKWKVEVSASGEDMSEEMFTQSIAELQYRASVYEATGYVEALNSVFKSDKVVSNGLRERLVKAVMPLENVDFAEKDWHPHMNNQVLDLVHPSIYPLVYGQTKILPKGTVSLKCPFQGFNEAVTLAEPDNENRWQWSEEFQWLPADFKLTGEKDRVKIQSYINNLDPRRYRNLYSIIEKIVGQAVPLWDATLSYVQRLRVEQATGNDSISKSEPDYDTPPGSPPYHERIETWRNKRPVIQPEPVPFTEPDENGNLLYEAVKNNDYCLQVIVKLANIHLTPDSPKYPGGSWHIEGQANENICASALYYYDSSNITDSYLAFRECVDAEDGRLLTFPNFIQHQVQPFSLLDKSKPGHRKLLALFLIDPHSRIISTANIPAQQRSWWEEAVNPTIRTATQFSKELVDMIVDEVEYPVTLKRAKEQRLELMQERSRFQDQHQSDIDDENTYNLCEH